MVETDESERRARCQTGQQCSLLPVCDILPETRKLVECDGPAAIGILRTKYRSGVKCQHGRLRETHEERHQ